MSTRQHYKPLSSISTGENWYTVTDTILSPLPEYVFVHRLVCFFYRLCFSVQHFSDDNQMNNHNLAIVFGPTLFQTDGKDYAAGRAIEDLIEHYKLIFEVSTDNKGGNASMLTHQGFKNTFQWCRGLSVRLIFLS